jgi:predicted Zn finger-like uncharacterized protein
MNYICPECGASYDVGEDEVVVKCEHCSTVFKTLADQKRYLVPVYYDSSSAIENYLLWVKKQLGYDEALPLHLELKKVELHFFPFWAVTLHANTSFNGTGEDAEYSWGNAGGYRSVKTIYREEQGSFDRFLELSIPASGEIPKVCEDYKVSAKACKFYSSSYVKEVGGLLHGVTVDADKAVQTAKDIAAAQLTALISEEVVEVKSREDDIDIEQALFLYVPVWRIVYRFRGKEYLAVIDAASSRTMYATYPPDIPEKAGYAGLGLAHAGAGILSMALLSRWSLVSPITGFVGFIVASATYFSRSFRPTVAEEEEE